MNYTVALAEDNQVNRNIFLQKINILGNLQVAFVAVNGHDCMEQLKGLPPAKIPQVIFMDLEMPEMDGAEALREIRKLDDKVPVMAFTAAVYDNMQNDLKEKGFTDYIHKPFRPDDLHHKIATYALPNRA